MISSMQETTLDYMSPRACSHAHQEQRQKVRLTHPIWLPHSLIPLTCSLHWGHEEACMAMCMQHAGAGQTTQLPPDQSVIRNAPWQPGRWWRWTPIILPSYSSAGCNMVTLSFCSQGVPGCPFVQLCQRVTYSAGMV